MNFESSYEKPSETNYPPFGNDLDYENEEVKERNRLRDLLCRVLGMCESYEDGDSDENDQDYSSEQFSEIVDNEVTIDAQPLPKDITIDNNNEANVAKSRSKRSLDDTKHTDNTHGHRAKRDLSWNIEEEDDIVPLDQLDFLAALANEETPDEKPQANLVDVLDFIEGIRKDRLSAGDILEEFEVDEEQGGLPFDDDTADIDQMVRKRGASRSDMKHYVQSLPTLEGMKKRSSKC